MNLDEFLRGQPITFEEWYKRHDHREFPEEDRVRLQENARRLLQNSTLKYLLSLIEAKCLKQITELPLDQHQQAEEARMMLRALTALRNELRAFADDLTLSQRAPSSKQ